MFAEGVRRLQEELRWNKSETTLLYQQTSRLLVGVSEVLKQAVGSEIDKEETDRKKVFKGVVRRKTTRPG